LTATTSPIGFIGLGNMGQAMARRLLATGHDLVVHDQRPDAVAALLAYGGQPAGSAREVADHCHLVFGCLPPAGADAITTGADGVPAGAACRLYVETSLIGRPAAEGAAARLRVASIDYVDAPISGGPQGALEGRLAAMISGSPSARDSSMPYLRALASTVFELGDAPGLGQICKIANNMVSMTAFAITCEAAVMAVKAGIAADKLIDVLNASSGRTSASSSKFPHAVLTGTFKGGGAIGLVAEDMDLFVSEAAAQGVQVELARTVAELWAKAATLDPDRDFTRLIESLECTAGVRVRSS
jgi:3-hydroxyisobutyrate dehydrogenase-like beta-hydroxyacid dehydrogenase